MVKNYDAIVQSAAARSEDSRKRVLAAIESMQLYNEKINVSSVAKKAGVSKNYIYSKPELIELVSALRSDSATKMRKRSDEAVIATLSKEVKRLQSLAEELRRVDEQKDTWHSRYVASQENCKKLEARNKELLEENRILKRQLETAYSFSEVC